MKTKFPYHEAAELRTEELWACKNCGKAWAAKKASRSDTFNPEIDARSCCTGQRPCSVDGCTELSLRFNIGCSKHDAIRRDERWRARERAPLNGHMIYSEALERFFHDEGEAWTDAEDRAWERIQERVKSGELAEEHDPTHSEILAEIEAMHLVLCEPEAPPVFEISRHLEDWLPNDGDTDAEHWLGGEALAKAEKAVNDALEAMPPLYMPSNKALDLSCFAGPDGPFVKADEAGKPAP